MTFQTAGTPDALPVLVTFSDALRQLRGYVSCVRDSVVRATSEDGTVAANRLDSQQLRVHGLAWLAAYEQTLIATHAWATDLQSSEHFGRLEHLLLTIGFSEYLLQIGNGIAMSQDEIIRPALFQTEAAARSLLSGKAVRLIIDSALNGDLRRELIESLSVQGLKNGLGHDGLDETLHLIRQQFRRYADNNIVPHAQKWHRENELIPSPVIQELAEMGVFGITVPEEFGGMGLDSVAMCVITEELSRGYIGVGSLGTRSEIACELIKIGGTAAQKAHYLPRIASGQILPVAVFTEPNNGSDLAGLQTRAKRVGDHYQITGSKTWITHASRSDLMTLLARTGSADSGYKGLTMFLAEKPRGTEADPFPARTMKGSEIGVLGYRGMREYELSFDGFEVPATQVLGGHEGSGFKQLMTTFELARIQTAARALGVAQSALELGFQYASDRIQFGKSLIRFPRVYGKLAWIVVELMMVRQLTYHAAGIKESGKRCDVEAGMAKLIAARVAWSAADNALQIHGGNGYALESPISRVLCDARILNVFEGAAEIQAQVIGRSLLQQ